MALLPTAVFIAPPSNHRLQRLHFPWEALTFTCALSFEFPLRPGFFPTPPLARRNRLPPRQQTAMPICNWWSCSAVTAFARPLAASAIYGQYAAAPWPTWDVPPAYLTAHGYELMKLFGAWDRTEFASEGLLRAHRLRRRRARHDRCRHRPAHPRNRQSPRRRHVSGLQYRCSRAARRYKRSALPASRRRRAIPITALATAAVAGRIGGNPNNLTETYRPQLRRSTACWPAAATCPPMPSALRSSTFPPPRARHRRHPVGSARAANHRRHHGRKSAARIHAGHEQADTGWGCLDGATLRTIMQVNSRKLGLRQAHPGVARIYASNLSIAS